MKKVIKLVMPLGIVILLAACSSKQLENKEHLDEEVNSANTKSLKNPKQEEQSYSSRAKKADVVIMDDILNAVYPYYVDLTQALTNGDAAGAKIAASAVEVGAKAINGGAELASLASKITNASTIETQRDVYSGLSTAMIALVKQSGLQTGQLYVSYCSMKNGSWLSNSKQIRNPYYGQSMLTCGETKETIK